MSEYQQQRPNKGPRSFAFGGHPSPAHTRQTMNDARPEAAQLKAIQAMANNSTKNQQQAAIQRMANGQGVVQRVYNFALNGYNAYSSNNLNQTTIWRKVSNSVHRFVGKASNFGHNGSNAYQNWNYTGVDEYRNEWGKFNGLNGDMTIEEQGDKMDNSELTYNRGHILPNQLGGRGQSNNLFKQNAGQNNSNPWKKNENDATEWISNQGNSYVYYEVDLDA